MEKYLVPILLIFIQLSSFSQKVNVVDDSNERDRLYLAEMLSLIHI